ncbi:hypothetical protein HELRODRAFT_175700 [Helobdella robusta]|uniref:Uncharacterized protein n=1 Tax=Helobdella robusta TaxID=6412 RepID=T1F9J5_HELRO|nr:hypothetical protein HELRODRAFT_175700 [Helobdella robusta]ESO00711.1 hypothetical protein HELRODRAFT_175700 [Helobdella robusta]
MSVRFSNEISSNGKNANSSGYKNTVTSTPDDFMTSASSDDRQDNIKYNYLISALIDYARAEGVLKDVEARHECLVSNFSSYDASKLGYNNNGTAKFKLDEEKAFTSDEERIKFIVENRLNALNKEVEQEVLLETVSKKKTLMKQSQLNNQSNQRMTSKLVSSVNTLPVNLRPKSRNPPTFTNRSKFIKTTDPQEQSKSKLTLSKSVQTISKFKKTSQHSHKQNDIPYKFVPSNISENINSGPFQASHPPYIPLYQRGPTYQTPPNAPRDVKYVIGVNGKLIPVVRNLGFTGIDAFIQTSLDYNHNNCQKYNDKHSLLMNKKSVGVNTPDDLYKLNVISSTTSTNTNTVPATNVIDNNGHNGLNINATNYQVNVTNVSTTTTITATSNSITFPGSVSKISQTQQTSYEKREKKNDDNGRDDEEENDDAKKKKDDENDVTFIKTPSLSPSPSHSPSSSPSSSFMFPWTAKQRSASSEPKLPTPSPTLEVEELDEEQLIRLIIQDEEKQKSETNEKYFHIAYSRCFHEDDNNNDDDDDAVVDNYDDDDNNDNDNDGGDNFNAKSSIDKLFTDDTEVSSSSSATCNDIISEGQLLISDGELISISIDPEIEARIKGYLLNEFKEISQREDGELSNIMYESSIQYKQQQQPQQQQHVDNTSRVINNTGLAMSYSFSEGEIPAVDDSEFSLSNGNHGNIWKNLSSHKNYSKNNNSDVIPSQNTHAKNSNNIVDTNLCLTNNNSNALRHNSSKNVKSSKNGGDSMSEYADEDDGTIISGDYESGDKQDGVRSNVGDDGIGEEDDDDNEFNKMVLTNAAADDDDGGGGDYDYNYDSEADVSGGDDGDNKMTNHGKDDDGDDRNVKTGDIFEDADTRFEDSLELLKLKK